MAAPQTAAAAKVIKALFAATIVYQSVYLYRAIQKNPSPYFEQPQPDKEAISQQQQQQQQQKGFPKT